MKTLNFSFIQILERRLDNILYKSGFVKNISQSRQLINHKKVYGNLDMFYFDCNINSSLASFQKQMAQQ